MKLPKAKVKATGEIVEVNQIDLYSMVAIVNEIGADENEILSSEAQCSISELLFLDEVQINYEYDERGGSGDN